MAPQPRGSLPCDVLRQGYINFLYLRFPLFPRRMNGLPGLPVGQELKVLCCSERAGWSPRSFWRLHPPCLVPGIQTLQRGGQEVTFHSSGLGCRPPGHRLLESCQGNFSFILVKFHLCWVQASISRVAWDSSGSSSGPVTFPALWTLPTFRVAPPQGIAPFHSFIQQAFTEQL